MYVWTASVETRAELYHHIIYFMYHMVYTYNISMGETHSTAMLMCCQVSDATHRLLSHFDDDKWQCFSLLLMSYLFISQPLLCSYQLNDLIAIIFYG